MQNLIQKLFDEIPVLLEIAKELPPPFNVTLQHQTGIINDYLVELNTIETGKNSELQTIATDLLNEIEAHQEPTTPELITEKSH